MTRDPDLDLSGGATREGVAVQQELAHPYLELQLLSADQQEFRLPFLSAEIDLFQQAPLAFPAGSRCLAQLQGEQVLLACDGQTHRLEVGSRIEVEGNRICLLDARLPPLGILTGLSAPYAGRVWSLTSQQTWLGRKGKRLNHIEVNHASISRAHLTLSANPQGRLQLLAEGGSTSVNGQSLRAGEMIELPHGALLGGGELNFRFSRSDSSQGAPTGELVGDYAISGRIGQGGMSEVFRARRRDGAGEVAMKVMHRELARDTAAVERFRREVRAYQALSHRNLPSLLDWGEHDDGRLYLVMELLEGETLKQRLEVEPILSDAVVAQVLTGVAAGLDYLHANGFIHRDVKPSNVFCLRSGGIKLLDLGIALDFQLAPLTQAGVLVGTPHYTAPEQISKQATAASDQYSMAVMAHELLTGRRMFSASTAEELVLLHQSKSAPLLGEHRPSASPELEEALQKALSKNPLARFSSCGAAAAAITCCLANALADDTVC